MNSLDIGQIFRYYVACYQKYVACYEFKFERGPRHVTGR